MVSIGERSTGEIELGGANQGDENWQVFTCNMTEAEFLRDRLIEICGRARKRVPVQVLKQRPSRPRKKPR